VKLGPVYNGIVTDCHAVAPTRPFCCGLSDVISVTGSFSSSYLNTEYASLGVKNSQSLYAWIPQGGTTEVPSTVSLSQPISRSNSYSFGSVNYLCESARASATCVAGTYTSDGSIPFKNLTTSAGVVVDAVVDQVGYWTTLGPWTLSVVPRDPRYKPFITFMASDGSLGYTALRACHKFTDESAGFCFALFH
jgi:hypothetical protein